MKKKKFVFYIFIIFLIVSCSKEDDLDNNKKFESEVKTRAAFVTTYPTVSEIIADKMVSDAMDAAWTKTKNSASRSGRREYGFFIYYIQATHTYRVGTLVEGPLIAGCVGTQGRVDLGKAANGTEVCAFFHTHTPLTYCDEGERPSGPSPDDIDYAKRHNLPGIIYDYSSFKIYAGHSLNNSAKLYTYGPSKRPDLPY